MKHKNITFLYYMMCNENIKIEYHYAVNLET